MTGLMLWYGTIDRFCSPIVASCVLPSLASSWVTWSLRRRLGELDVVEEPGAGDHAGAEQDHHDGRGGGEDVGPAAALGRLRRGPCRPCRPPEPAGASPSPSYDGRTAARATAARPPTAPVPAPTARLPADAAPRPRRRGRRPGRSRPTHGRPTRRRPATRPLVPPTEAEPIGGAARHRAADAGAPAGRPRYASGAGREPDGSSSGVEAADGPGTRARARADCGSPYEFIRSHLPVAVASRGSPGGAGADSATSGRFGLHPRSRPVGCQE